MNRKNSVSHVYIPGKGTFKILFQEEELPSILSEVESDYGLRQMIKDSRAADGPFFRRNLPITL